MVMIFHSISFCRFFTLPYWIQHSIIQTWEWEKKERERERERERDFVRKERIWGHLFVLLSFHKDYYILSAKSAMALCSQGHIDPLHPLHRPCQYIPLLKRPPRAPPPPTDDAPPEPLHMFRNDKYCKMISRSIPQCSPSPPPPTTRWEICAQSKNKRSNWKFGCVKANN